MSEVTERIVAFEFYFEYKRLSWWHQCVSEALCRQFERLLADIGQLKMRRP